MHIPFKTALVALLLPCMLIACESEDDIANEWIEDNKPTPPSGGSLDISKYVAIGNSLTAGFTDGALNPLGQANSYPAILANQLKLAGGGEFRYPDISQGEGFGGADGNGNVTGRVYIDLTAAEKALEDGNFADVIQVRMGSPLTPSTVTGAAINNYGVPGARAIDITVEGYGNFNPFYGAFQSSATASMVNDASNAQGSFLTIWIGANDALGYANDGGAAGEAFDPSNANTLTSLPAFTAALKASLDNLLTDNTQAVILNVPPVTLIPFHQIVTTLGGGVNLIPLPAAFVGTVNNAYSDYNQALEDAVANGAITQAEADSRKIEFKAGANPPVITDESLTDLSGSGVPSIRPARADAATGQSDLFPLTALNVIGQPVPGGSASDIYGVSVPIPDNASLTIDEQANVISAYSAYRGYNAVIKQEADSRANLTLVDVGPVFADLFGLTPAQAIGLELSPESAVAADGVVGIRVNGVNLVPLSLTREDIFNSLWSADGVHPNPRGAAIIANTIIDVINAKYNASIPKANPLDYPAINAPL